MTTAPAALAIPTRDATSLSRAYRHLLVAVVFSLLAFGVGASWDRAWHATHPFEDFWSPPHLFIYTTHLLATLVLARIALSADLRRWFGAPARLPLLGVWLPGALALAGGGFAVIALAGFFDSVWHGRFGLDETAWSFPHAMLGSGILLSLLGFVSCRVALAEHRPLAPWAPAVFAVVLVGTTTGVLLGPLDNNHTLAEVRAIGALPPLRVDPDFQHLVRITVANDLTRSHPLFLPLSALAVGIALALARGLVGRAWVLLLVAWLAMLLATSGDRRQAEALRLDANPANWLPIPYLVPAVVAVALERWSPRAGWLAAGFLYGIVVAAWWGAGTLAVVLAAPLMAFGATVGARLHGLVARPGEGVPRLVLGLGLALPTVTGFVDLVLRARTP